MEVEEELPQSMKGKRRNMFEEGAGGEAALLKMVFLALPSLICRDSHTCNLVKKRTFQKNSKKSKICDQSHIVSFEVMMVQDQDC